MNEIRSFLHTREMCALGKIERRRCAITLRLNCLNIFIQAQHCISKRGRESAVMYDFNSIVSLVNIMRYEVVSNAMRVIFMCMSIENITVARLDGKINMCDKAFLCRV